MIVCRITQAVGACFLEQITYHVLAAGELMASSMVIDKEDASNVVQFGAWKIYTDMPVTPEQIVGWAEQGAL